MGPSIVGAGCSGAAATDLGAAVSTDPGATVATCPGATFARGLGSVVINVDSVQPINFDRPLLDVIGVSCREKTIMFSS
jgi:hypothetical protein